MSGRGRCACARRGQRGREACPGHSGQCRISCGARLERTAGSLRSLYQEISVSKSAVSFSECFLLSHSGGCCPVRPPSLYIQPALFHLIKTEKTNTTSPQLETFGR